MRWGVVQRFRHFQPTLALSFSRFCSSTSSLCLISQRLHQPSRVPWTPSADLQTRRSYAAVRRQVVAEFHPADSVVSAPSRQENVNVEPAENVGNLQPELERVIDALPSHHIYSRLEEHGITGPLLEMLKDRQRTKEMTLSMMGTARPNRILMVLKLANHVGCKLNQSFFESLAFKLAESSQWGLLCALVRLGRRITGRTTARLLNWYARGLIECEEFHLLDSILEDFHQLQLEPNRRTYHLLVTGHLRNRDVESAKRSLADMAAAGFPIDASTHTAITAVYRRLGPDPAVKAQALDTIEEADERAGTTILNSLLQWSLDSQDIPDALRILCRFDPTAIDFGHSVEAAVPSIQGNGSGANAYIDPPTFEHDASNPSSRRTYPVDVATFSILLKHFSRRGNLPRAIEVFKQMNASGFPPNDLAISELVRAHFNAGKPAIAVQIVADLCRKHSVPRKLFENIGMVKSARTDPSVLHAGASLSPPVFNALIEGVLPTHGLKGLRTVYRIMGICGVSADADTIQKAIQHLVKDLGVRPQEILKMYTRLRSGGAELRQGHLNAVFSSLLQRRVQQAWSHSWRTTRARAQDATGASSPSMERPPPSHAPLEDADFKFSSDEPLGSHTSLSEIYDDEVTRSLASRHVKSDRAHFTLRIKHYALLRRDLEAAKEVFRLMLKRGVQPNAFHYSALMQGYVNIGEVEAAMKTMYSAKKAGIPPNLKMYTILIKGLALDGMPARARTLLHELVMAGIEPDVAVIDAVASAYFAVGATLQARMLLLAMWPHIAPFPEELRNVPLLELAKAFRRLDPNSKEVTRHRRPEHSINLYWRTRRLAVTLQRRRSGRVTYHKR